MSKPLNETPAARTHRVLGRLSVPNASTIAWLGAAVAILVTCILVAGILLGGSAADIFQGYSDKVRGLGSEP